MDNNKTNFGFKQVEIEEKSKLVKQVFSNVANKYDLMNDLMSFGIHRRWKNKMVEKISLSRNCKIIDVAGGTGDIAFRIANKAQNQGFNTLIEVVDINQEMLNEGKKRSIDLNLFSNLNFALADGENLPYQDQQFDYYTIAFGIRNFTNIKQGLCEAHRILKKNGKFICLEFAKVNDYFFQQIYDQYSFKIIPKLGELILKDQNSYQYLVESIRNFPPQNQFKKMIEEAGFSNVSYQNLNLGIVAIYEATKL